jgi:hypothetical protein
MIAPLKSELCASRIEPFHQQFLTMLPMIRRQAYIAFRGQRPEAQEEFVAEVIANAYCAYMRLVCRNKQTVAFPTPLAQFAIRQVRAGRRVGCSLNSNDLLSSWARKRHGLTIEQLDQSDNRSGAWHQLLVEDRQAGPAETAAARLDVAAWLGSLSKRQRRIAKTLAVLLTPSMQERPFLAYTNLSYRLTDELRAIRRCVRRTLLYGRLIVCSLISNLAGR